MKRKFIQITANLSVSEDNRFARFSLEAAIPNTPPDEISSKALKAASLAFWESNHGKAQDKVSVPEGALELTEDRYVYKDFRALSQIFLQNRGLDFSRPGVLKAAVDLLKGKTIYANHDFRDIDNWRGVVADAYWDAEGTNSNGVPGINIKAKVDAFLNYRTACGLMMTPPAINAGSCTVVSEVEFSHPELVKNGTFWDKFLEEVDGEIVRLIVIRVIEFIEFSFVFLGEDRLSKPHPDEDDEETIDKMEAGDIPAPKLNATEKNTMKITEEQKTLLGITADGDDVPEQTVLDAAVKLAQTSQFKPTEIADLSLKATEGEKLLKAKREEVKNLARLAEFGAEEGNLNDVIVKMIDGASADDLQTLEADYRKKLGDKFPPNGKSSLENDEQILNAGGLEKTKTQIKPTNLL